MPFVQLSFETGSFEPEALEAACFEAGALSVTLTDAADVPICEPGPGETPLWPRVRTSVLFAAQTDGARIVRTLEQALGGALPCHTFSEVADRAWEREWLLDFKPMRFGRRLWIYPHGHEVAVDDAGIAVVRLDPGLAFGTGTHPTTAMCLQWLDGAGLTNKEVIDYGCGSGVLAIAALKLGARRAVAVDHDPQALQATGRNALENGVADRLATLAPGTALQPADVLLANILALPLIELAGQFRHWVRAGGDVVLSGILAQQADEVLAAYRPWFDMQPPVQTGEWVRLHGVRR